MADSLDIFPESGVHQDFQPLYQSVYAQVKKDFHPYIMIKEAPELLSSQWLYAEIRRMLTEVIEKQNQSLGPIIYRVDLSEKVVNRTMQSAARADKLDELTLLVLRREAQKIWIRNTLRP